MIGKLPEFFKSPHALANAGEGEPILIALSGGADSVSLLHLLCELRSKKPFPLYAAHVNHGIRVESFGNEAVRDENFCKNLCLELKVELFTESINVPAISKASGKSLETAARDARYAFFARIMREKNIKILATAHNADDNFETQLFNLCRGCGTEGLRGIPESRAFPEADAMIVRPILTAPKSEILEFCRLNGFKFVTDSTNLIDDCTRNKLRLNIIPQLKEIFGTPERAGTRLAEHAKADSLFIESEAEKLLSTFGEKIECKALLHASPALFKRIVRMAFERHSQEALESIHTESILEFAAEGKNGRLSLPGRVSAIFENGYLTFGEELPANDNTLEYDVSLGCGITFIYGTNFAVCLEDTKHSGVCHPEGYIIYAETILCTSGPVSARNRREGDLILSGGMHKKVKKLMCDKKVPKEDRNTLPLIISGNEILWAPLCAIADSAKKQANKCEYKLTVYKKQIF